jgi:hypothetical protein
VLCFVVSKRENLNVVSSAVLIVRTAPDKSQNYRADFAGRHDVRFYSDDAGLLDDLTQFIGAAFKAGNAAIVVATGAHQEAFC